MILIHLLLASFIFVVAAEADKCSGMTFTVTEPQLRTVYKTVYSETAKYLPKDHTPFSVPIFSPLGVHVKAKNIIAHYSVASEPSKANVTDGSLVLENPKDFLVGNFTVECALTILWIEAIAGTITVTSTVENSVLKQTFSTEFINTTMSANVKTRVTEIKVSAFGETIGDKLISVLDPFFKASVLGAFRDNMNGHTKYFYDWHTMPVFEDKSLPIIIHNDFRRLQGGENKINYCFNTWIGIEGRPYAKAMHKLESQYEMDSGMSGQACLTDSVLLALPEVMAKARKYLRKVNAKDLGLDNRVGDLIPIIAKIQEVFNITEELAVGCRANSEFDLTVLNLKSKSGMPLIQVPLSCSFAGNKTGQNILNINVIARAEGNITRSTSGINIRLQNPILYNFNYQGVVGPVNDFMLLQVIGRKIAELLEDEALFATDLNIGMGFGNTAKKGFIRFNRQNCFTFAA